MSTLNTLTTPPPPPGPADGANFGTRAFEFLNWWYTVHGPELNTWVAAFNSSTTDLNSYVTNSGINATAAQLAAATAIQKANDAQNSATAAGGSATTATTKASEASTSAAAALASQNVTNTKAAEAVAAAASISKGTAPNQLVRAGDLGTAAWLDQTWIRKETVWDAPSCANAAQVSTTVATPGAEIGDKVFPSASIALSGLNLRGEVTATDVVTLYLSNLTGAAVDLASATYYILVLKRTPAR